MVYLIFFSRYLTLMPLFKTSVVNEHDGWHMSLLCVATLMARGRLTFNELGNVQLVYFRWRSFLNVPPSVNKNDVLVFYQTVAKSKIHH